MTEASSAGTRTPLWLQGGFRLLFLGGAAWALIVVTLWVGVLDGFWTLPTAMAPLAWHQHEMLFGYLGAVIAGFLSAAIPNWTGRPIATGWPVAAFVGLWAMARIAVLFSASISPVLAAVLDVGFLLMLFGYAARQIFAAGNRNKPILIVLLLFAVACGLDHAAAMGLTGDPAIGMRAGFALVLFLIAIIGGRIIPAFTRNWLVKKGDAQALPILANRFDHALLAITAMALAGWVFASTAHPVASLLLVAGLLHAVRLTRWAGLRTTADPLVFVLHVSYAWLPAGLLLLGAAILWPIVPASSAMHALGAGAMASMTLAVMTRATRGHTGHPLEADGATVAIYALVNLGALLRVAAPLLSFDYMLSIHLAGGLWASAFLLFILVYGRMALRRPAGAHA
ncbi:NnrS family protein [Sphingopyxis witflariensis]|nr:NnrS family protein [Sphingopyxis witflariensis]